MAELGPGAAALHEIVDGVHAWVQPDGTWWVNNAGLVVGADAALLIDTCATEARTRRLLAACAEVTGDRPLRYAANTHQHGDHTYGNSLLPDSTLLIGHHAMRQALVDDPVIDGCPPFWTPVPEWGDVERRVPQLTFASELTVHTGGRTVELRHPGFAAHTAGDAVAWLPEERVLFAGDLVFHGLTPLVFMGSIEGALRSLDFLAAFNPEHVVPGHGPLLDAAALPRVLAEHEQYYRFVRATAIDGHAAGLGPLDAARHCDLGEFSGWADAERIVLNLHRAYAEQFDVPFDLLAALDDAVAWNGGPMATAL